jgi:hypothetical protein
VRPFLATLVAAALVGCGTQGAGDGTSGIRGRALAGPQCPVEVQGSPCPDLPWEGTVVATHEGSGRAFTARTDADGHFELSLSPGTYVVAILSEVSPPSARPQTVVVEADAFTEIVVSVDTGIR